MYVKLGLLAIILVGLFVSVFQNQTTFDLRFIIWDINLPFRALVLYLAAAGAVMVAILALPRLVSGHMRIKRLNREIHELKECLYTGPLFSRSRPRELRFRESEKFSRLPGSGSGSLW